MARPITKKKLIESGVVDVIARKGLRGTTIQDIASQAGVSPGLLYRYWTDRDDLAAEVYRQHFTSLLERVNVAGRPHRDLWDKLHSILDEFLIFADESPIVLKFLLLSQHDLSGSVAATGGIRTFLRSIFAEGIAQGVVREADPDLALQVALGIAVQPVVGVVYGHLAGPARPYSDKIFAALMRALATERLLKRLRPACKSALASED